MGRQLKYINGIWTVEDSSKNLITGKHTPIESREEKTTKPDLAESEAEEFCSKTYLRSFTFHIPDEPRRVYPYRIVEEIGLHSIQFAPITILYGGNGSGKSTLLNIMADCIKTQNKSKGNTNEYFADYVEKCNFEVGIGEIMPDDKALLRSEDILDMIMKNRRRYSTVKKYAIQRSMLMPGMNEDKALIENMMNHPDALTDDDRFYLSRCTATDTANLANDIANTFESNGETAMSYIRDLIMPDSLYFLDEPEVSLSPLFQKELADMIQFFAEGLRTQFIIATHSPFFLSIKEAKIYDIDSHPATESKWYELENMKTYFRLFYDNREQFIQEIDNNPDYHD